MRPVRRLHRAIASGYARSECAEFAVRSARGSSDKNFRLCPSTDGRPYLLGFENFLTGVTGRGGKEDGLVPACACDHMCPHTPRAVPKRFICFFGHNRKFLSEAPRADEYVVDNHWLCSRTTECLQMLV